MPKASRFGRDLINTARRLVAAPLRGARARLAEPWLQGAAIDQMASGKMSIALKEARETPLRLRLLATAKIMAQAKLHPMIDEAEEIKRVLGAIIVSAKKREN